MSRKARIVGLAGGLHVVQLAVFIVAAENANWTTGRNMRASLETLAGEAGFSLSPVRRAVRALEDGAWMRCDYRSKGGLTASSAALKLTSTYFVPDAAGRTRGQADQDEAGSRCCTRNAGSEDSSSTGAGRSDREVARSERPGSSPVGATGK